MAEEEEDSFMDFTFDVNSIFYETISTVIERAIADGTITKSLPLKFAQTKFKIVGNADNFFSSW